MVAKIIYSPKAMRDLEQIGDNADYLQVYFRTNPYRNSFIIPIL
jgi:hypothetical protein